ncbi:MAG: molybdenum ABC transporter ATP-binding protein [Gammaproteobacteria bacterium]
MTANSIDTRFKLEYSAFSLDVDLQLPGHGVTALFGPSGSGKTTLLRCIAGLERTTGRLSVNGEIWQDEAIFLPTHKRPLGYVFQEANLFPHLSILGNLKYGMKREPKKNLSFSLDQAIDLLGICHLLARKPDRLSGGERQRVAIARALAVSPRILLMDEPLAALDLARKREILPFLERLHDELEIPMLYVTHSPDEVARLADHLVVLSEGKALASGSLTETLARLDLPIHMGQEAGVVLEGKVVARDSRWNLARAEFAGGHLWIRDMNFENGQTVRMRVLARDVSLALEHYDKVSIVNLLPVVVRELGDGDHTAVKIAKVQIGDSFLLCRLTSRSVHMLDLKVGKKMWAQIKSVAIIE